LRASETSQQTGGSSPVGDGSGAQSQGPFATTKGTERFRDGIAKLVPSTPATGGGADTDGEDRRALTNGFGDTMAKAFEMVATPAVFGFLGWLLDRWLGTKPLFLLSFVIIVFVYEVWKLFAGYGAAMAEHEARLTGKRKSNPSP
jgi:F0F1-type ATP synthase assembly protein I